jgi:hypothetical protein
MWPVRKDGASGGDHLLHLHRAAADGRQHPQDPRLAGPHRHRPDRHHPPGTATPRQPARLPPRRLTARSTRRHTDQHHPGRVAATPQTRQNAAIWLPEPGNRVPHRGQEPISDPTGIIRNGHRSSSVGMTPTVLSVTLRVRGGLNTETGEISPDRGNHAIRVTRAEPRIQEFR